MSEPTVMIVEDDQELRDLLKIRVESLGYKTLMIKKGDEALDSAQETLPSLVILDIFLPDVDGLTVLKRLKAPLDAETGKPNKTKDIPIIVITGKAPMIENMTRVEGAIDFFVKPIEMEKLIERIHQILESDSHAA